MGFILGKTITETYLERVKTSPGVIGFQFRPTYPEMGNVGQWKHVTFKEFHQECRLVSYGLMGLGVKPGDRIAIISSTRYEWSLCDLAIMGTGAISVPIYASNHPDDVAYILEHSEVRIAMVEDWSQLLKLLEKRAQQPDLFPSLEKIIVFEPSAVIQAQRDSRRFCDVIALQALREVGKREEGRNPSRFEDQLKAANPSDCVTICYTSGTTGVPKGVQLTHDQFLSVLEDCVSVLRKAVRPEVETVLAFLPFSHIFGRVESLAIYTFGWRCVFSEGSARWMSDLKEVRPTIIFSAPRFFEKVFTQIRSTFDSGPMARRRLFDWALQAGKRYYASVWSKKKFQFTDQLQFELANQLILRQVAKVFGGRLKFAISGGAPLSKELGEFFQIIGVKILEGYGLTETCAPVAVNSFDDTRFGVVGKPLPEVTIKIAPDGEILVKSRKVFQSYYKMPEETSQVLKEGWFYTGDIGFLDAEGYLHITDRKKDMIVTSGGKNIAPQKIENLAASQKALSHFVVLGDRRNFLTALITLEKDQAIRFANENQVLFSEYSELIKNSKMIAWVQKMVDEINRPLSGFEKIKKFLILPNEFTVEGGELTPTLKVRRNWINQKYKEQLDTLYEDSALLSPPQPMAVEGS